MNKIYFLFHLFCQLLRQLLVSLDYAFQFKTLKYFFYNPKNFYLGRIHQCCSIWKFVLARAWCRGRWTKNKIFILDYIFEKLFNAYSNKLLSGVEINLIAFEWRKQICKQIYTMGQTLVRQTLVGHMSVPLTSVGQKKSCGIFWLFYTSYKI